jgi:hypothetical protein
MAEEHAAPCGVPSIELDDSSIEARDISSEFAEATDDDFVDAGDSDLHDTPGDAGPAEGALPSRRRRRRRGRRGVHREDAFLGIDRLATDDIVGHEPPSTSQPLEEPVEDREGISLGEELTSIEIDGDEENGEPAPSSESEVQRKRRRRRRRGRGSKEQSADRSRADDSGPDTEDDSDAPRRERLRPAGREEQRPEAEDIDDDLEEDTGRPNKNLHREVTPWAEAIGFIVNTNMEARARSPGRWGKSERRN